MMSTHILVVEDEPAIQELLVFNVLQAGFETLRASTAEEAWQQIQHKVPDLIVLDWMLPNTSGVVFAKQLRSDARTCSIPIVMLTARGDERDKVMGLEAGADDYMTKPFSPRELMARVRAILRRCTPEVQDEVLSIGGLTLSTAAHRVTVNDEVLDLGPTEFRLLHFFMTHPERVYSRVQLLDQVWGTQNFVEERTVDVHIRRLRAVLEPCKMEHLIQTVRSRGYMFSVH